MVSASPPERVHLYGVEHIQTYADTLRCLASLLDQQALEPALERLRSDLTTGRWHRRHTDLLAMDSMDLSYRLLVGGAGRVRRPDDHP